MNLFRIAADLCHLASVLILIHKMRSSSSASGISFKSQFLYQVVYIARYLGTPSPLPTHYNPSQAQNTDPNICSADLFWTNPTKNLWNTFFKIIFILSQSYIIYLMLVDYKPTHDPNQDTFKVEYLLGGALVLGVVLPPSYAITEMLWAFSLWLESVAILPQLFMLQRTGEAETITTHYLFALGAYRALYIPNWIYRYFAGQWVEPIAVLAGIVQTVLYSDFFYIYWTKVLQGKKFNLPV
ncbi:endoplasmic reticulum retention protein [Recurvomyces mirabilis]|nr:endoplasmic reticulum retention protein [Recurvomyces mirabilis]